MADNRRWYFTKEQLENSPSIQCGYDKNKELSYRQQAANIIQDVGQKLKVNQLCINTAIVYMHRFFMFHSFTRFHRNGIATAALFLAAKVEEQPRSLEHIIQVSHLCMYRDRQPPLDTKSERYAQWVFDLIFIEDILLQTLGFDVAVDHPHTHIVHCCHMVKADKDLARTSYFMASNSLHLTTMCLQYKPTVVACVCIHIACKWSNREIPLSKEGKNWFWYIDRSITFEQLEQLTAEFLAIFDRCPTKLKHRLKGLNGTVSNTAHRMNGVPVPESQSLKASLLIEHSFSGLQCSSSASNHVAKAENSISATTAPSSTGIASQSVKPPKSISDIFDKSRKPESLPDKKLSTKYLNTGSDKVNCVSDIELVAHITSLQGQKKRDPSWLDDSTQLVPFSLNFKASQECFHEDRHKPERSNKRQRQL